jgi:hypothetical protein
MRSEGEFLLYPWSIRIAKRLIFPSRVYAALPAGTAHEDRRYRG